MQVLVLGSVEPLVKVSHPLKPVRNSTAAPYHGCKIGDLNFYEQLEVKLSNNTSVNACVIIFFG